MLILYKFSLFFLSRCAYSVQIFYVHFVDVLILYTQSSSHALRQSRFLCTQQQLCVDATSASMANPDENKSIQLRRQRGQSWWSQINTALTTLCTRSWLGALTAWSVPALTACSANGQANDAAPIVQLLLDYAAPVVHLLLCTSYCAAPIELLSSSC